MRRILVFLATMVMGVVLASGVALAAVVSEVEPNDSIPPEADEAQEIDAASFDLTANPDIFDSTTVPHATVNGTGETGVDPTHDFYKFTVPGEPGEDPVRVVLDMDRTTPDSDTTWYDPWIQLYDSSGTLLEFSDDWGEDPGSPEDEKDFGGLDSRIVREGANKLDPGTYYVGVGAYDSGTFGVIPAGSTYQLHVSVGNDITPPDTTITEGPTDGSLVNPGIAAFSFSASGEDASEEGFTFECRLDDPQGDFTFCFSPTSYSLSEGSHTFEVRATDAAGNVDATPASRTWTVSDATAPTILSTTPADGATKVPRTNPTITATFSEEMGSFPANSFRLEKLKVQGKRVTVLETVSTTVVNPANPSTPNVVQLALDTGVTLDKGSYYQVTITTAATDVVGNHLQPDDTTWRFKTLPK